MVSMSEPIYEAATLQEQVDQILGSYPDTHNSMKLLAWKVWSVYYGVKDAMSLKDYFHAPSELEIRACAEKLLNK